MGQEHCVDCISLTHGCLLGGLCWTRFGIVGADERIMVDFRLFHRQISSNNHCGMKTLAKGHTAKIGTAFTPTTWVTAELIEKHVAIYLQISGAY